MASAFAHAFTASTLAAALFPGRWFSRLVLAGIVFSILPDADVVGFRFGVSYGDLLGHRGLSHSIAFAAVAALVATPLLFGGPEWRALRTRVGVYLFIAMASHGFFDAMTDNGLGIAFFSPFDPTRYFLPFRPVMTSPMRVSNFFTERSIELLFTELVYIALPWALFLLLVSAVWRRVDAGNVANSQK